MASKLFLLFLAAFCTLSGQIAPQYLVNTVAGVFPLGDGGPAVSALLESPQAAAVDANGNVYIADSSNLLIRKVTPSGTITSVSGYNGSANDVKIDSAGNLYIAEYSRVVKLSPDGRQTVMAGSYNSGFGGDGGQATAAQFRYISGIAIDDAGNLYIADQYNHRVRKVDKDGVVQTVAGTGTRGYNGTDIAATTAQLNYPASVVVDAAGTLYISDSSNWRIRKISSGTISIVAGTGYCCTSGDGGLATAARLQPYALTLDKAGNIYFVDGSNAVRKIAPSGIIQTVAGAGYGYRGDGALATAAWFASMSGITLDSTGNLYIVIPETSACEWSRPAAS